MRPRTTHQLQAGGIGISEVSAAFERLDWGVVENARHDLGTDLFGMARDARGFDLGLIVGIQVKAGPSYFEEPAKDDDGNVVGWWFRDSDRAHIDAWLRHQIPHLVVLHELGTRTSYWAHVTCDAVVSTGVGAKILVSSANTVDEEHRDVLLEVAASVRPAISWEGSAWTGAPTLTPSELLRHALLTPRLVAPHPNAGHASSISAAEAVALVVQARIRDLRAFADNHPEVPTLAEAINSESWEWRFVGVLADRLLTGKSNQLAPMIHDAPNAGCRTAATIAASAELMEQNSAEAAIELLQAGLSPDDADPVDEAWLRLQMARASAEIGLLLEARNVAAEVQAIRVTHPNDLTASAIAGTAARLIFATSAWGHGDVSAVILGADTITTWWRAQTLASGLADFADREFKAWARDQSRAFGGADTAHNQLFAAGLAANHLGSQDDWRRVSSLLGADTLIRLDRNAPADEARAGLNLLRQAGDDGALKLAIDRLRSNGPAAAIRLEAAEIRLDMSTRTTGPTNLTLLQRGGDIVDEATADRSVAWLLEWVANPESFMSRTTPSYLVPHRLVETLGPLIRASSIGSRRAVIRAIRDLQGDSDQLLAAAWGQVVRAIPGADWDEEGALDLARDIDSHDHALRYPFMGVAARFSTSIRADLAEEMRGGSLDALAALGSVAAISDEDIEPLIGHLVQSVHATIASAHTGSFGFPQYDPSAALTLVNAWHPAAAQWAPVLDLLRDQQIRAEQKAETLAVLVSLESKLPPEVRPELRNAAVALTSSAISDDLPLLGRRDGRSAATALAELLDDDSDPLSAERFVNLLAGGPDDRQWAARIASRFRTADHVGFLATLAQDSEPKVRAIAAGSLATIVGEGAEDAVALSALRRASGDPGVMVPGNIAAVLSAISSELPTAAREILRSLETHISASVRLAASGRDAADYA